MYFLKDNPTSSVSSAVIRQCCVHGRNFIKVQKLLLQVLRFVSQLAWLLAISVLYSSWEQQNLNSCSFWWPLSPLNQNVGATDPSSGTGFLCDPACACSMSAIGWSEPILHSDRLLSWMFTQSAKTCHYSLGFAFGKSQSSCSESVKWLGVVWLDQATAKFTIMLSLSLFNLFGCFELEL